MNLNTTLPRVWNARRRANTYAEQRGNPLKRGIKSLRDNTTVHFGGRNYVLSFGGSDKRIVAVRVNPKDLVCVPHDCQYGKVRVCTYKVLREIPQEGEFKSYWNAGLVGESECPGCSAFSYTDVLAGRECPSCGTFYGEDDEYCRICGAQLPETEDEDEDDEQADSCPNCGTDRVFDEQGEGAAFCTGCGHRFED